MIKGILEIINKEKKLVMSERPATVHEKWRVLAIKLNDEYKSARTILVQDGYGNPKYMVYITEDRVLLKMVEVTAHYENRGKDLGDIIYAVEVDDVPPYVLSQFRLRLAS